MGGMGMCMGCVMTSALTVVGKAKQSQGNAILNTLQQFAGAIGTQEAFGMLTVFCIIIWISYYRSVKR
ncbi:permease [Lactobacillus reuteri]|nr:permease [Limosilactobacillus reuteri]